MRVKLDSTRKKIEKAALEEFYQHGFKNASMRVISKKAGMTVGNLYCYYLNKEDMFRALLEDVRNEIITVIHQAGEVIMSNPDFSSDGLNELMSYSAQYIHDKKKEFVILFQGSKGSLFADTRQKTAEKFASNLKKIIEKIEKTTGQKFEVNKEFVIDLMSETYINMLLEILKKNKSKEWIEQVMYDIIRLLHSGMMNFFKK
ncbi:MAG: hypothetical protein A2Y33_09060 [Spirochaetes bacterium GWF1_51_8]|nr:MAG: hypothetical protein A2Y33_09060 [Spirochaetes bacterium GWF1_51_8]